MNYTKEIYRLLKIAICLDDIDLLKRVINQHNINIVLRIIYKCQLYLFMSYHNSIQIYNHLLTYDNKLAQAKNKLNISPLHLVNNNEMLKLLLDNGANSNLKDNEGITPIIFVSSSLTLQKNVKCEMIHNLLQHGANINDIDNLNGDTVLHKLINSSHQSIILTLLHKNIKYDILNRENISVLDILESYSIFNKNINDALIRYIRNYKAICYLLYFKIINVDLLYDVYFLYL
jgi:ankyrin repeat protein